MMTALEAEVFEKLQQPARLLHTETLAAILQRPVVEIDRAVASLRAKRLVVRNYAGQWAARR